MQSVLPQIHGAALIGTIRAHAPKAHAEKAFRIGGGHAQNTGDPAPEYGARAAQGNGGGNAYNISGAKSGCQSGRQSGKGRQILLFAVSGGKKGKSYGLPDIFLRKMQFHGKIKVRTHQQE